MPLKLSPPALLLLIAGALAAAEYFPEPDAKGGWRRRDNRALDPVFEYMQGSSKHGGLLAAHKGWMIYERYFGAAGRESTPNLASCGKSFTSVAIGILMHERPDLFPHGLDQKVFTPRYFPPEMFPLADPAMAEIKLGQLLAMTAGLRGNTPGYVDGRPVAVDPPGPDGWAAMVDSTAMRTGLWRPPGAAYSYATISPQLASILLRHVTGMELSQYLERKIARPLGWGKWGFGYRRPEITHTPGGGGIEARATDMLRFAYMLLREGRWKGEQIVPAEYVRKCARLSTYNPHYPYSLQFDVNGGGRLTDVPRDAFWKTGSGGHAFYIVPSMDLVIWKLAGRDEQYGLPASDGWRRLVDDRTATDEVLRRCVAILRAR